MPAKDGLRGYTLVDSAGATVGPIIAYRAGDDARATFAAVRTGFPGRDHVVPLRHARLDEARRLVQVPYERRLIHQAPAWPMDGEAEGARFEQALLHYRAAPPGVAPGEPARAAEIPLHRERVDVGKRVVEAGGVRLRKVVRREIVHVPVEVLREEIVVERVPPGESPALWDSPGIPAEPFVEGSLFLPELREEPVVAKSTELVGGVRASRRVESAEEVVRTELRREDVEVARERPGEPPRGRD